MRKINVQLCSISTIHQNWIPYASGCLISYCKSIPEINEQFEFLDPIYKVGQYDFEGVDILGLTCYVWNQSFNDNLAQSYKKLNPKGTVIYGGPQIPEDLLLKEKFDNDRPWLDKSIIGLGEIAFSEWLLFLPPSGKVLNKLPTPYTDGIFDTIFNNEGTFKVSFESNRGCPYKCAYCDWGGQAKSKLTIFDQSDVFNTIDKIYQYPNIKELEILDANFGILEQDIDIINYMISCQEKYNNRIKISYSGLAKNGSKHLPVILSKIFESLPVDQRNLKVSFQTHTPEVLKVIQRSNIDNKKLMPLVNVYKKKNIPITSEMIIALPGETADSWLKTLAYNYEVLGIDHIRTYILHLVANVPMNTTEYKEKYQLKSKKIQYGHEEVEIVHKCYSFDLDELVKMFDYHWVFNNLINSNIVKSKSKDIIKECKYFFESEHPFLDMILNKQRNLVKRIFEDIPISILKDKAEIRFFCASLRTNDLELIINNSETVKKELYPIYGNLNINWICDDPLNAVATVN